MKACKKLAQPELVDGRTVSTQILIMELVGRVEDEELERLDDDTRAVMWCSARRLLVITKMLKTAVIGLAVTNTVWIVHALGYI